MQIYIIRHGETELNKSGIMQGCLDEPLNENGRFLAKVTGKRLQGVKFDYCVSSPYIRAIETAEILLRESGNDIGISTDDRLREMHFGSREGKRLASEERELFFSNPFEYGRFPNGESVREVCERTQSFLKELIDRDDNKVYLISTHGCALRAMLNWLYTDSTDYWHGHVPYNCCVNIIEANDGKAKLIADDELLYDKQHCVDWYTQN